MKKTEHPDIKVIQYRGRIPSPRYPIGNCDLCGDEIHPENTYAEHGKTLYCRDCLKANKYDFRTMELLGWSVYEA